MNTTRVYETVVFLDGDGYDQWEALMYPDRTPIVLPFPSGHEAALAYLMRWEHGDGTGNEYDHAPWGSADYTHEIDGYVMSWHPGLSYASLTRVTDVHDTACEGCEHDCPHRRHNYGAPYCQTCDDHAEACDDES